MMAGSLKPHQPLLLGSRKAASAFPSRSVQWGQHRSTSVKLQLGRGPLQPISAAANNSFLDEPIVARAPVNPDAALINEGARQLRSKTDCTCYSCMQAQEMLRKRPAVPHCTADFEPTTADKRTFDTMVRKGFMPKGGEGQ